MNRTDNLTEQDPTYEKSSLLDKLKMYIVPGRAFTQFRIELQRGAPIESFLPTVIGVEAAKTLAWVAGGVTIGNYLINRFYDLSF